MGTSQSGSPQAVSLVVFVSQAWLSREHQSHPSGAGCSCVGFQEEVNSSKGSKVRMSLIHARNRKRVSITTAEEMKG